LAAAAPSLGKGGHYSQFGDIRPNATQTKEAPIFLASPESSSIDSDMSMAVLLMKGSIMICDVFYWRGS